MSFFNDFPEFVDHVTIINASQLNALRAKIGDDGSAVVTSLDYLLKNPASIDPGHKHSPGGLSGGADGDLIFRDPADHIWKAAAPATAGVVAHALATAANDFLVASGAGAFVKKPLAETQAVLGLAITAGKVLTVADNVTISGPLGTAAYVASADYAKLAGRTGGQTLIGGSAVTDILKFQGTSGNGTQGAPAIQALVGNNGAIVAVIVLNNGNVGIGMQVPQNKLDIGGLEYRQLRLTETKTDSTLSRVGMVAQHYLAAEEPLGLILGRIDATTSEVYIGGGVSYVNAATGIRFFLDATSNTTIGTEILTIINNSVGLGINTPNAAALLHLASTTKGFLPPVMTTTEKAAISSPPEGLTLYDLTLHAHAYFNATVWKTVACLESPAFTTPNIGVGAGTSLALTGGFGCNGKTIQTAYASGGALAAYVDGAHGLDSAANMQALYNKVVAISAALVANGIMS